MSSRPIPGPQAAAAAAAPEGALAVVAIVGRPNVGKSSLVNRVLGRREAIVEATPGVTRDRRGFLAEWGGRRFEIIDTGGLEPGASGLEARVAEQARVAIEAADSIVLVTDATVGPLQDDLEVAAILRRSGKPVVIAVNKVDDARLEAEVAAFFRLGLGDPMPVSALHGRGSGDFLDHVIETLPPAEEVSLGEWAAVALVGRPNVGKSSLLNVLLGEERALVDPVPGTTRDPTDSHLQLDDGRRLRLVDTAGMRRRTHITDPLEYFSWLRSRGTLTRVDAVALVVDASDGVTGIDQRLAEQVIEAGRACVVVANKWDLVTDDNRKGVETSLEDQLRFLAWAPRLRTSALSGRGVAKLVPALEEVVASHRRRLPTAQVNALIRDAQERRPHPRRGGRAARVRYAAQVASSPPRFVLFTNARLEPAYLRYLENRVRAFEAFSGTPVRVDVRRKPQR